MPKKVKKTKEELEKIDMDEEIEYSDEVEFESENIEENFQDKLKKLKEELKKCKKERQEYLDGWQRARADYANLKVEEEKKRAQITEVTKEGLILSFLPILDSFDMAFVHKEAWEKVDKEWRVGVENIYNQLLSIFKEYGVSEVSEKGILLDPDYHQSVETIETKKKEEDGKVAEIVTKGYKLNGRVLRPARVKVYKYNSA